MFRLVVSPDGTTLSQKVTGIFTNIPRLKAALRGKYLCDHHHPHWILKDGKSIRAACIYPKKFQRLVAREIKATINDHRQSPAINRCFLNHFEVNPHKLVYNRVPNLTLHSYPNEEVADEGENMSEDLDDPVSDDAPAGFDGIMRQLPG